MCRKKFRWTKSNFMEISINQVRVSLEKLILKKRKLLNYIYFQCITLLIPNTKIAEFANCVNLDEVAHDELPHLDLHCMPSSL